MAQRKISGPVVLVILDGVGSYTPYEGNAVSWAHTPFLAKLWDTTPHGLLFASAEYVGLPMGVKGNSEVGHTNLGAGRVVYQNLPRIDKSIEKGTFFTNPVLLESVKYARAKNKTVHIMGCISDGKAHSSIEHIKAFLEFYKRTAPEIKIYIHAFTDGRDAPPQSAPRYFKMLESWINTYGNARIASIIGRQLAMDRNFNWERTQTAYDLLTLGKGIPVESWQKALDISYGHGITDEFIKPFIVKDGGNIHVVGEGDVLIFFNYRPDRAIQLTKAFVEPVFMGFKRKKYLKDLFFVAMTQYSKDLADKIHVLFPPHDVKMPIGQVISMAGMRQLRLAESVKFPHVTYFFNGGSNVLYPGEDRVRVPSPDVPTFDLKPEMSLYKVLEVFKKRIKLGVYDFFVINFANGDMVGHSGNLEASIQAMQHIDNALKVIARYVLAYNGLLVITADHGNVEEVINQKTGGIDTEHSIYPVPIIFVYKEAKPRWLNLGKLADVAPSLLYFMGLDIPGDYTGRVLI